MKSKNILPFLAIFLSVFLACIILIWLDHETTSWDQVFNRNIIITTILYGLPALLTVSLIYSWLSKRIAKWASVITAVIFGIPSTFVAIILILLVSSLF